MAEKRLFMEYHVKQSLPVSGGKKMCQNAAESSAVFPEKTVLSGSGYGRFVVTFVSVSDLQKHAFRNRRKHIRQLTGKAESVRNILWESAIDDLMKMSKCNKDSGRADEKAATT